MQDSKHGQDVENGWDRIGGMSNGQKENIAPLATSPFTIVRKTDSQSQETKSRIDSQGTSVKADDEPETQSPTQYEETSSTEILDYVHGTTSAVSDPNSQLLMEAARDEALAQKVSLPGVKRNHDTAMATPAQATPTKARKEDGRQLKRIDTNLHNKRPSLPSAVEPPAPMTVATPERMTTRVSSGAIRHKSVSEILGETPRSAHVEEQSNNLQGGGQTPRATAPLGTPHSAMFQSKLNELREKERDRNKMSTVVFPRQPAPNSKSADGKLEESRKREKIWEQKDYLAPLFYAQASAQTPKLNQLVVSSKKTLSTSDHRLDYREDQDCRILKRIYHLQNNNRWSLRQLERAKESDRPLSHWDSVLGEVRWMRTDFREERRWKIAAAKNLADWCAEYVSSTKEEKKHLRVRLKRTRRRISPANHTTPISLPNTSSIPPSAPTPDLIPSVSDDTSISADEDMGIDVTQTIAPAALFNLPPADILFDLQHTPATDKMLEELPLYKVWTDSKGSNKPYSTILDSRWKLPIIPVIKYATGKVALKSSGPIRKRTRFEHTEDEHVEQDVPISSPEGLDEFLPLKQDDVALFNPENKHIIARLHAAHAFRPPSEFAMPAQGFFEARQPSQWIVSEDDQLRRLVREYEYNWPLISACMSSQSLFVAGAERRTPWECFERWVSFEGLPGEMAKHQYFRAWNQRREAAKEHLEQLYQAQLQNPATSHLPPRRRNAEPITVERRKQGKYLSLFTITSKVIKKREIALAKQQASRYSGHSFDLLLTNLGAAATQKKPVTDSMDQRPAKMRTPREFSQHKYKQECEFREKRLLYQQTMMAQHRASQMAKAAQANGQAPSSSIPGQAARAGMPIQTNGTGNHFAAMTAAAGNRNMSNSGMLNLPNGVNYPAGQMNMRQAAPTPAQMAQAAAFMQQQNPRLASQNDPNRVMMEAVRVSEQQRLAQQRQFQANGLTGVSGAGFPNAMFSGIQTANGKPSSMANGITGTGRPSSSAGTTNGLVGQQLSNGMVPLLNQVSSTLKAQHPNATQEQIMQLATMTLSKQLQRQQQNGMAMNGNAALQAQMALGANGPLNPQAQQYAALLRNQQFQQANQQGRAVSAARSGSPNDTSRPGSQGSAMMQKQSSTISATTQSPRPLSAQMTGSS